MRSMNNIVAMLLIVLGVVFISYAGFTYTTQEKIAQIGTIKITNDEQKTIPFSPIVGGICLVVGIILIVSNRMKR